MAELNLPNIREGGNIRFRIGLEDGGVAVDWSGLEDIRVFLYADAQKQVSGEMCEVAVDEEDNTVLKCKYSGDDVQYRGINSVLVRAKYLGEIKVYDKPAINIVARTSEATGVVEIDDPVVPVQISVEDVSTSLLNNAIDAAINAAAEAEKAAHLVPLQVLEDCVEATGKALEAASKAPYIDETTGNWFVWDAEAGEYVDSGKTARGATGNGIASWSVVESAEDAGNNVVTVTFTDGTSESFNVKNGHTGNGIASIVQTVESPDDAGTNVITITMTNGTVVTFNVKNGSKGTPGVAQAAYKSVDTLPTASAQTMDKIYLTPSGTSGVYNMSYTEFDGSAYSWQDLGTTAIQLSDYATKAELSQLEHKVDENALYSIDVINLDESSEYYHSSLVGAYVPATTGKITSNQYTVNYKIWLFSIPAGSYVAKKTGNYSNQGVIVGTLSSEEDLVAGTIVASQILKETTPAEVALEFASETYLFIVGRLDSQAKVNFYATCEKVEEEETIKEVLSSVKEKVDALDTEEITESLSKIEGEVFEYLEINLDESSPYFVSSLWNAYIPYGTIVRNNYTNNYKIWMFRIPAGNYFAKKTGSYTVNQGSVLGTLESASDLEVGTTIASTILGPSSASEVSINFASETYLILVGRIDSSLGVNFYASCVEKKEVSRISELEEQTENMFKVSLDIVIPDVFYAIVGTELNLYNDAVSLSIDRGLHSPLNYQVRWSCNKGTITDRCFRFTPASDDVGDVSCTCYLYDMRGVLVSSKTFTIKVLAKNALASAKNIVYFGDSLGPSAATALYDNFHDSNRFGGTIPKMLGTKGTTKNYEAVGGYKWSSYATAGATGYRISVSGVTSMQVGAVYSDGSHNFEVYEVNITEGVGNCLLGKHFTNSGTLIMPSGTLTKVSGGGDDSVPYTDAFQESVNPLLNDTTQELDINQYKQTLVSIGQLNSVSDKIDAVSFQFGINDNTLASNLDTLRGYISDLYDLFVGDNADCKFIVGLTTSSGNDVNGSGANYGATNDWKAYLKNTYIIRKFYLSLLTDFPNMRIATPNLSLDRYYGYALGTRQVSDRCSETEQYHTNYVHPGTSGYWQMADAYLACYVGVLTES